MEEDNGGNVDEDIVNTERFLARFGRGFVADLTYTESEQSSLTDDVGFRCRCHHDIVLIQSVRWMIK